MPFFSIIIPLYNKERFIADTLQSVLSQSFKDFEVIIVNDGSTDNGEQKVQAFNDDRIQYYLRENKGVAAARNFGITLANAPYIAFLDADDYWYPDFLQQMHKNISRFKEQFVFAAAIEIETQKNVVPAVYSIEKIAPVQKVNFFEASLKESVIWTSSVVIEKRVFEKVGVFDPTIKSGQDTDLWIRIGLEFEVVFDWKILARYTYDSKSLSRDHSHTASKLDFTKFAQLESQQPNLKRYLDLNRYSLAVKSKLGGDQKNFKYFSANIAPKNLTLRKRILLHTPGFLLRELLKVNRWLANNGLSNSVFR